jgi:peptidoglycan/LPS O-acetylase OafA/YrhL
MKFILGFKHWQVFFILLIGSLTSNFTWENHELFNLTLNTFGLLIYFFWYFAVGLELTEHLPSRVELPRTLFIVNAFVLVISMLILVAVFNGEFSSNGILGFFWIVYLMYAIFQFMFYPSKALRTMEQGTEATFGEYFKYGLLTILWPIGIWWIQPKLNKIFNSSVDQV